MPAELIAFFGDLDFDKLRINRPSKFVFLCGGKTADARSAASLRDYLLRKRNIQRKLNADVVLAEKAVQIYRETTYTDLISFEEDIARISSVVLVIAESAGSLAELGSFSSNETIRKSLRVIVQQQYATEESFVRYGPIQRVIKRENRDYVGFYPWRIRRSGQLVQSSARIHYAEIRKFIRSQIDAVSSSELYRLSTERQPFYVIYWIIYLALAVSPAELQGYVKALLPHIPPSELRNKLYCMELAGWIGRTSYSNKDYFFVRHDQDPFDYAFRPTVVDRDSVRRKFAVAEVLSKKDAAPPHVRKMASDARRRSVS